MAHHAHASATAKAAAPKREPSANASAQTKRVSAPAVQRIAPRHSPCACGGHCPKCQRSADAAPALAATDDSAAEHEAEQLAALLLGNFGSGAPVPPPDENQNPRTARVGPPPTRRILSTAAPDAGLGSGQPLPDAIRQSLEAAFDLDLSALRIHTGSAAEALALRHHARAFTYGSHLVFGRGEYAPHQAGGQRVLAHEIVHAVQQSPRTLHRPPSAHRVGSASPATSLSGPAHNPWANGTLSQQARPRGPPRSRSPPLAVRHHFTQPRVQCIGLPSWDDVSNTVVNAGSAALDTAVDVGSTAVGVAADIGEGALELGAEVVERTADFFIGLIDEYAPGLLEFLRGGFMGRLTDLFCRGLDAVIGGLISSLENIDFVSALEEAFASAQGSVEGVIGAIRSGASSALGSLMQPIVEALDEYGPGIIDAITGASDSVNGFFDSIWESIGAPALDFLGEAGGEIWQEITDMIDWLWEATSDVRELAADAWEWVMEQFDIAWSNTSGIRDWLAEKATEAWDSMKEALGPLEGPITVLLGTLVILSPLGPIVIATQVIPPLWEKLVWLWNNWNTDDILIWAQDTLREDILPGVINLVSGVASAIANAASWIAGVTVQVADAFSGVLGVFGANTCLATVTRVLNAVSSQFERLAAWAEGGFTGLADAISNVFNSIVAILQPILDFLIRLFLVVTNPPMLPIAIAGAIWLLIPDELKPPVINFVLDLIIAFLRGFPAFLTGLGPLASILKAGFLGFLGGLRGQEDQRKIDASNKVANLMAGAGLQFIAGFAVGILEGLLDGILDPFRLIWMLIQFLARLCRAIGDYLAPLVFAADPNLGAAVGSFNSTVRASIPDHPPAHAPPASEGGTTTLHRSDAPAAAGAAPAAGEVHTLTRATPGSVVGPTASAPPTGGTPAASPEDTAFAEIMGAGPTASDSAIVASLSPGLAGELTSSGGDLDAASTEGETSAVSEIRSEGSSVGGLSALLGNIWNTIIEGAHSMGGRAANALIEFIMLPDYELGNKIGYVAGLVLLEVIIAYFSGGVSVELKAAEPFIKAAIRFLDLGGEILGLLGRAVRPIKGPLLRGLSAAGEHLGRFRFLQPILQRVRRAADVLFHFGDEAAEAAGRAGGHADDVGRAASHADDAARRADDVADAAGAGRKADDAAGAGHHADDAADSARRADDAALEAAEKPAAVAMARSICETNDAIQPSPPVSAVLAQLMALRAQFTWIDTFRADPKGPGRYEIHMIASDTVVDNTYTPGTATEAPPRAHSEMSIEELRAAARTDPDAAYELWRRYQNMPREELRRLARQGDESAQAVLRQTEVPGSEPWLDPHEFLSRDPGMPGQSHHIDQDAAFRDVIPRDEGLAIKLEGNAFTQPGTPHYEAHRSMEAFWDQFRPGGARFGQRPNQFEYTRAVMDAMIAAGYTREQALAIARASLENRLRHGLAGAAVPRIPGRLRQVQPKLVVTQAGDRYEHEADRVADTVTSSGEFTLPAISAYQDHAAMPATFGEEAHASADPSFERALDSGESSGSTLPDATRSHMEQRFGVDFSGVRVHTDGQSAALNRQVDSLAFTTGHHIYFAPSQYRPGTASGDRLLAHELTHVVQQSGGNAGRRPVQRFEIKKYYAYGFLSGRNTHEIAETALRAVNPDLITEAPIPGATSGTKFGPGSDQGYFDKVGRADLYQSSDKGNAIGVKGVFGGKKGESRHLEAPEFKYAGFSSGETKQGTGTPAKSPSYNKLTGGISGEFPTTFSVADLKPLSVSKTGEGFAQIANYCEGLPNFVDQAIADKKVSKRTKKGKPLTGLSIPAGHDMRRFKSQHKLPGEKSLVFAASNQRLWLYPHKSGIYFYLWLPNTFTTPGSVSTYQHTKAELTRMVTELKRPPAKTKRTLTPCRRPGAPRAPPQQQSQHSSERTIQRKKPATPLAPHAAGTDWSTLGKKWEGERADWAKLHAKPLLAQTKSFEEIIDAQESLGLSKTETADALGADLAAQAKEHERMEFWAGLGGQAIGSVRFRLGPIFDKVAGWFDRIAKKFKGIQGKVEGVKKSFGFGWRKTLITILIKGVKLAFTEFLHATYSLFADCFNGVIESVTNEFMEEANEELRVYLESLETKFTEFKTKLETEYEATFDALEEIVKFISDAKMWLDLALTLEGLIRTGMQVVACLSPPALGCLWGLVAQVGIEVALDLIIDTDWFQNNIGRPQIKKIVDRFAGPTYRKVMQEALEKVGLGKYAEEIDACHPTDESFEDLFYTGLPFGLRSGSPELMEKRSKWEAMHRKTILYELKKHFTGKDGKPPTEDELLDLAERLGEQHPDCEEKKKVIEEALKDGKANANEIAQPEEDPYAEDTKEEGSEDAPPASEPPPDKGEDHTPPAPVQEEPPTPADEKEPGEPGETKPVEVTVTPGTPTVPVVSARDSQYHGTEGAPMPNAIVKVLNPSWDHTKGSKGEIRLAAFLDGEHVVTMKHIPFIVTGRYYYPDKDNADTATELHIKYELQHGVSFSPHIPGGVLVKGRVVTGKLAWGKTVTKP